MTTYPSGLPSFPTRVNTTDDVDAAHQNDQQAEIIAIATELGTTPSGNKTDLKTRLAILMDDDGLLKITGITDNTITNAKLKTSQGTATTTSSNPSPQSLPGGEYGFFPQIHATAGSTTGWVTFVGGPGTAKTYGTSAAAIINLSRDSGAGTVTATQRYVTASGMDHWIFVTIDKRTGEVVHAWEAPDHPAYGNGGNYDNLQHPFMDWKDRPDKNHEIVLIEREAAKELRQIARDEFKNTSPAQLLHEGFAIDLSKTLQYAPIHSGRFKNEAPERLKTVPNYLTIRTWKRLNESEINIRKATKEQVAQQEAAQKAGVRDSLIVALDKIAAVAGMSDDEVRLFRRHLLKT